MRLFLLALFLLRFNLGLAGRIRKDDNPTGRDIQIINHSDVKVDVFWVNPNTKELVKSVDTGILKGTDSLINSYIGHEFEVQELPRKATGLCRGPDDNECRRARFVVTNNEDQRFTIEEDVTITYGDARSRAMEKAKRVSRECPVPKTVEGETAMPDLEDWAECLQRKINATLDLSRQEIEFQASVRKSMGRKLANYACVDEEFPTSTSTYNQTLNLGLGQSRNPEMRYLFQSETSKVVVLENFIARSQCKWLQESARNAGNNKLEWSATRDVAIRTVVERMHKAMDQVLDYTESDNFLDQQLMKSHVHPLFELETMMPGSERSLFLAEEDARDPLMGSFLLFCDVPKRGGAIHFPKAGIHVTPKAGQALLATYLDPNTGEKRDDAFSSEFVECPVVEGQRVTLKYHIPYET